MTSKVRYQADTIWDMYRAIWRVTGRQQLLLIGQLAVLRQLLEHRLDRGWHLLAGEVLH